ncbi:MAG: arsenate reductase family protein [Cellulosilyticaceae bacterium]
MEALFIHYPKCTTCKKALKYLKEKGVRAKERHIVEANPIKEELKGWIEKSGLPIKKFFNTSGILYREMQLKDKLPTMSEEEMLELLASDGMLVKRPLLVTDTQVLVGFKEAEYEKLS